MILIPRLSRTLQTPSHGIAVKRPSISAQRPGNLPAGQHAVPCTSPACQRGSFSPKGDSGGDSKDMSMQPSYLVPSTIDTPILPAGAQPQAKGKQQSSDIPPSPCAGEPAHRLPREFCRLSSSQRSLINCL